MGYCTLKQVLARLYSGQTQTTAMPVNADRDDLLNDIIDGLSREFDKETGRVPGGFDVTYEARYFSGLGNQVIDIDEFATLSKLEYNTTIFGTPTWNDITAEVANGRVALRPIRYWPKRQIFRLNTWIVDPYGTGNTRLTGIWGAVQPVKGASQPQASVGSPWNGITTQAAIQALAPDPTVNTGWWQVPADVSKAIAAWTVYEFKGGQAAWSGKSGTGRGATADFTADIPGSVQRVINSFKGGKLKLALIGLDGSDVTDPTSEGGSPMSTRWAGWQTINPNTGQSN